MNRPRCSKMKKLKKERSNSHLCGTIIFSSVRDNFKKEKEEKTYQWTRRLTSATTQRDKPNSFSLPAEIEKLVIKREATITCVEWKSFSVEKKKEAEEEEETYLVASLCVLHRDDAMFCVALLIVLLLHQFFVVLQVFVALQVIPCCSAASWSRLCRVALRRVAPRCISSISCTHLRESTSESKHIHRETDKHTDRELTSRCNNQQHSSYRLQRRTTATRIGERGWLLCLLLHFCCSLRQ